MTCVNTLAYLTCTGTQSGEIMAELNKQVPYIDGYNTASVPAQHIRTG